MISGNAEEKQFMQFHLLKTIHHIVAIFQDTTKFIASYFTHDWISFFFWTDANCSAVISLVISLLSYSIISYAAAAIWPFY